MIIPETNSQHTDLIAFWSGLGSLIVGILFCGLALAIRHIFFFALGGIVVLMICLGLVLSGLCMLIVNTRQNPKWWRRTWRPWVSLTVLILNLPLGLMCVNYTFEHCSLYTIRIINDSQKPLNSVSLRSDDGGSTKTLASIPPEHRFMMIVAGKQVAVKWDARDEGGVRLRSTWNGQTSDFNVTGYTFWEEPLDCTVRINSAGKITVNGKTPNN